MIKKRNSTNIFFDLLRLSIAEIVAKNDKIKENIGDKFMNENILCKKVYINSEAV